MGRREFYICISTVDMFSRGWMLPFQRAQACTSRHKPHIMPMKEPQSVGQHTCRRCPNFRITGSAEALHVMAFLVYFSESIAHCLLAHILVPCLGLAQ